MPTWTSRTFCVVLGTLVLGSALEPAAAEAPLSVKIGVVNDRSGPYADVTGEGSVVAARMAVEDSRVSEKGIKVEVVFADHQNKPDIGANIVRRWIDQEGVDVVADTPTSSVALAINEVVRQKNKVLLVSGGGTSELTGKACSPNTIQWTYDTWSLAVPTAEAVVRRGGDTWFFITADYAYGIAAETDTSTAVRRSGGNVVGSVRAPFPTSDFSSYLLQAQTSQAKVIALANASTDTITSIKQAAEFGITTSGQKLVALLMFINDVHALGLRTAQGLTFTVATYWDLNDGTRAFTKRFMERHGGAPPNMVHAGVYASVLHYLKAVSALSDKEPNRVLAKMKEMPTDDFFFGKGSIRADGRVLHDMYLAEVKRPEESRGPWDYYHIRETIPAERAFRPMAQGGCPLVAR